MRLLFIIPRTSGGGAEKVLISLASQMSETHEVYLAAIYPPDGIAYPISQNIRLFALYQDKTILCEQRLQASFLWKKLQRNWPERAKRWGDRLTFNIQRRLLLQCKKRFKIDCSISFLNPANQLNVATSAGVPAIISIRSFPGGLFAPPEFHGKAKQTIVHSCTGASKIVCVSREAAEMLVTGFQTPPEKIAVIYNPCDVERIHWESQMTPTNQALITRIEEADYVFFSNGRLTAKKGQWHLIRAFRQVVDQHPGAILVILGREQEQNTLKLLHRAISSNHLENNVFLPGFFPNPFPYLSKADAYVMSSLNEGFPNALIEAMALGLPVISTDCSSGPREILAPGTEPSGKTTSIDFAEYGILTPVCSGDQGLSGNLQPAEAFLADAMLMILENSSLRKHYALKSLERATQFEQNDIVHQWESLIAHAVI